MSSIAVVLIVLVAVYAVGRWLHHEVEPRCPFCGLGEKDHGSIETGEHWDCHFPDGNPD